MDKKRQLATILFADIQDYTAMMQSDEGQTMSRLRHYQQVLQKEVATYNGEIIKNYGDGSLCIFSSVLDGVQCAKAIQATLHIAPNQSAEQVGVPLRIGLHLGDVIYEANDIYGDALNIASRIESIGVAGSVLFSNDVAKRIKNHKGLEAVTLGSFAFKNVEEPMEVFALANKGLVIPKQTELQGKLKAKPPQKSKWLILALLSLIGLVAFFVWWNSSTATAQALSADILADKSIAVLAFRDLSPEGDQEYFGDGIAEEILNALDQLDSLRVIGRTSSFSFKGKDVPIPEIAQQLKVSTILEGSVRKFNNRVRINVKLVDAKADQQIWSQSFDRELADIFAIQNEIAVSVANNLKLNLLDNQTEQLAQSSTTNPAAYDLFLKAKALIEGFSEDRQAPIDLLMQAIKLDPQFVDAYAELALAKGWLAWSGQVEPKIAFSQAQQALDFGKNINPNSESIKSMELAINCYYYWDWEKVEMAIKQQEVDAHGLAQYYSFIGNHEKAIENVKISLKDNPLNLVVRNDGIGALMAAKKLDAVMKLALETYELFPDSTFLCNVLSSIYQLKGDYQKALYMQELAEKAAPGFNADIFQKISLTAIQLKLGWDIKEAEKEALLKELHEVGKNRYIDPMSFALVYFSFGEKEKALDYLEKAYESKSAFMVRLKTSPFFDEEIRQEPRFQAILKKMNFPEVVKG